jgi:competence protein ComEC
VESSGSHLGRFAWALGLLGAGSLAAQGPATFVVRQNAVPCLNIRARPQSSARPFACLTPGTTVEAVGTAPYWRQVRLADSSVGWAAKKFLEAAAQPAPLQPAAADRDDAWLEVHVVDVGQGDGIWIHTFDDNIAGNGRYEGYNIIIDGGPDGSDSSNQLLKYVLQKAHERAAIDALIITHPHVDHFPGASGILRHFEVREFYDAGYPKTGSTWTRFRALVNAEKFEGQPVVQHVGRANLDTANWGSELQVRFLYAYPGSPAGLGRDNTLENNASIVMRLEYGSQSILFMGDAEGKERGDSPMAPRYAERFLLDSVGPAGLRSTVLKIAHHGSETSSTVPFINAVDPDYVVVSSGRKSFSGTYLPDRTALARYCTHKAETRIYRTDQDDEAERRTTITDADGDNIVISTNGKETRIEAYSAGSPITPTACIP